MRRHDLVKNKKVLEGIKTGSYKGFDIYKTKDGAYAKKGKEIIAFDSSETLLKMALDKL